MKSGIKSYLTYLVVCGLFFLSSYAKANSVEDALQASRDHKDIEALKILSQLADEGNNIASYNLAKYYSTGTGIKKNQELADHWYRKATRAGLVEAYLKLNKNAIATANGLRLSFKPDPTLWLIKQDARLYTIQLVSSRNEEKIKKYYMEYVFENNSGYYRYTQNGVDRYALLYGTYKNVAAANKAIALLPDNFKKWSPWIRRISSLQKISK